jgi:hypothetical protein
LVIATIGSKQTKFGVARGFAGAVPGGRAGAGGWFGPGLTIWLPRPLFVGFGE